MTVLNRWRLLDTGAGDPAYNMALDEAVLTCVRTGESPPTIRFYSWSKPAITLGYRQDYYRDMDWAKTAQENIPVIRRITGGLAVYHWHELTYAAVYGFSQESHIKTARQWYLKISQGLAAALHEVGIQACINPAISKKAYSIRGRNPGTNGDLPLCFALPVGVDITVHGKKIIGSAQRRFRNVFLQQGSILIGRDPEREMTLARLAGNEEKTRLRHIMTREVTSIMEETGRSFTYGDLVPVFRKNIEKILAISLYSGKISNLELKVCEKLIQHRYGTDKWNCHGIWQQELVA